jgi:ferrous iron transport protein A
MQLNAISGENPSQCRTLAEIRIGQIVCVKRLLVEGLTRRRLLDLGLLPGTEVRAIIKSPLGDPTTYVIRGSLLALRSEDASKIEVETLPIDSQ